MIPSIPDWVDFDADKTTGLDLLGLRAPVQSIGNNLLNGLTSVTPKLRYLSVLTWISWKYAQLRMPDDWASFRSFAEQQEAMIVLANVTHDPAILRLVGKDRAVALLGAPGRSISLEPLVDNIALNIYASSCQQIGLTTPTKSGVFALTRERGEPLAKAFDKAIADTRYGSRLARKRTLASVSREELAELSSQLSLDRLPRGERDILIGSILPNQPIDSAEIRRLSTFALLLWLAQESNSIPTDVMLFTMAELPPNDVPPELHDATDGWLEYSTRDLLAAVHESVMDAVLREVDVSVSVTRASAKATEVVNALIDRSDEHDEILRHFDLLDISESVRDVSFRQMWARIQNRCSNELPQRNGLRRWAAGLSAEAVSAAALQDTSAAACLLPIAWCLSSIRVRAPGASAGSATRLLSIGDVFQIGIADVVLPKLDEFIQADQPYLAVTAELIVRTVQQHVRVAWSRFSSPRGKDVSVLISDQDTWRRNNSFGPGRTDSRLWAAIGWLEQLGLITDDGITRSGRAVLDRALSSLRRA